MDEKLLVGEIIYQRNSREKETECVGERERVREMTRERDSEK